MKDADKFKLMLLAWNYSLQQQAQGTGVVPTSLPGGGQLPTSVQPAAVAAAVLAQQSTNSIPNTNGTTLTSSNGTTIVSTTNSASTINAIPITTCNSSNSIANSTLTGERSLQKQKNKKNKNKHWILYLEFRITFFKCLCSIFYCLK